MKVALIGLGNPIVGDDAIGIKVVDYIRDTFSLPDYVEIIGDVSLAGIGLVEQFRGFDKIILVDSIQTGIHPKGTVVHLNQEEYSTALHISDYHNMDFFTALDFCNQVYDDIPKDITIIGIEIISVTEFSDELSTELHEKFDKIIDEVYKNILLILKEEVQKNVL